MFDTEDRLQIIKIFGTKYLELIFRESVVSIMSYWTPQILSALWAP